MSDRPTINDLDRAVAFSHRHIGPSPADRRRMLSEIDFSSLGALMDAAVPPGIRAERALDLPAAASETEALGELGGLAARNTPAEPMIGLGYYGTITPAVIRRNVLESPAWYTAYTPYQPEISQGRLEALLNFQTVVGRPDRAGDRQRLAARRGHRRRRGDDAGPAGEPSGCRRCLRRSTATALPQTIAVVQTRAEAIGASRSSWPT